MPDSVKHPTELGAPDFNSPVSYAVVPAGVRFTGNNIDKNKHFNVEGPGTIDLIAEGVTPLAACYKVTLDRVYKAPRVRNGSAIFNPETSTIDVTWSLPDLSSVKRQRIQNYQIYPRSSNKIIEEIPYMQIGRYRAADNGNFVGYGGTIIASEVTRVIIKLLDNLYFPYVSIQTDYGGMSSPDLYIPVIAPPSYKVPEYGLKPTVNLGFIPDESVVSGRTVSVYRLPVSNTNTAGKIMIEGCKDLIATLAFSDGNSPRDKNTGNPLVYNLDSNTFQIDIEAGITTVIFTRQVANTGSGSGIYVVNIEPFPPVGSLASHSIIIP